MATHVILKTASFAACEKGMEHLDRNASSRLYDVINAYEHAITSKYPKARLVTKKSAKTQTKKQ